MQADLTHSKVRRGEQLLTFKNRKHRLPGKAEGIIWGLCIISLVLSGSQHHLCRTSDTLPFHLGNAKLIINFKINCNGLRDPVAQDCASESPSWGEVDKYSSQDLTQLWESNILNIFPSKYGTVDH